MVRLDRDKALEFLREGFKQIGITPDEKLLEEAVEGVDGIIGWLTYLGVQAKYAGKLDAQTLESAVEKGARLSAQEVEHFLSSHPQARKRYLEILKVVASMEGTRWSEIKAGLETRERKTIADNTFSELLQNLVKSDLIRKKNEEIFYPGSPPAPCAPGRHRLATPAAGLTSDSLSRGQPKVIMGPVEFVSLFAWRKKRELPNLPWGARKNFFTQPLFKIFGKIRRLIVPR